MISTEPEMMLTGLFAQAYSDGFAIHGDIGLPPAAFESRLQKVIEKHLGSNPSAAKTRAFLRSLHTSDLYLAAGCSQPGDRAWRSFVATYQKYISDSARSVSSTADAGRDLAADVLSNLFLHDRSENSRIASFDGQQSLATWLLAIISHRAANETLRKWNTFERIDRLYDLTDRASLRRVEADLRANRYRATIGDCFKLASESLTTHERLVLLLRFDDGLRNTEIARQLDVHPSGVTRQLQHTCLKLKKRMISLLANKHRLGPAAIKECLADVLENPEHSIIVLIREAVGHDAAQSPAKCG